MKFSKKFKKTVSSSHKGTNKKIKSVAKGAGRFGKGVFKQAKSLTQGPFEAMNNIFSMLGNPVFILILAAIALFILSR